MSETNILTLAERYLNGELSERELVALNKELTSDTAFRQEFEENIDFLKSLKHLSFENKAKSWMDEAHAELASAKTLRPNLTFSSNRFRTMFIQYGSVAAITIFMVITTLYVSGWYSSKKNTDTYRQLKHRITSITNKQKSLWEVLFYNDQDETTYISGTCFPVSSNGYLVTSFHLVSESDSVFVLVETDSLVRYKAEVIFRDETSDLAVVKINDSLFRGFGTLPFLFNENCPLLGEYVYTLGFPKTGDIVFSEGSISSLSGYNNDTSAYQVSVPANPGNSGGPLVNSQGDIIGVLCAKNMEDDASTYAVKASFLMNLIDSLRSDSAHQILELPKNNSLKKLEKTKQIQKLQPFVFRIEVY